MWKKAFTCHLNQHWKTENQWNNKEVWNVLTRYLNWLSNFLSDSFCCQVPYRLCIHTLQYHSLLPDNFTKIGFDRVIKKSTFISETMENVYVYLDPLKHDILWINVVCHCFFIMDLRFKTTFDSDIRIFLIR